MQYINHYSSYTWYYFGDKCLFNGNVYVYKGTKKIINDSPFENINWKIDC